MHEAKMMRKHNKGEAPRHPDAGKLGTTHKSILSRWRSLTPDQLAEAIFDAVKGNCTRLLAQPVNSGSIWGVIVKKLNFANTKLDRLWAHSAFDSNAGNIKEILHNICNVAKVDFVDVPSNSGGRERYCFCRRAEAEESSGTNYSYPMLQCDRCNSWFHFLCLGIKENQFSKDDGFFCPTCEGLPSSEFMPTIFEVQVAEPDDKIGSEGTKKGKGNPQIPLKALGMPLGGILSTTTTANTSRKVNSPTGQHGNLTPGRTESGNTNRAPTSNSESPIGTTTRKLSRESISVLVQSPQKPTYPESSIRKEQETASPHSFSRPQENAQKSANQDDRNETLSPIKRMEQTSSPVKTSTFLETESPFRHPFPNPNQNRNIAVQKLKALEAPRANFGVGFSQLSDNENEENLSPQPVSTSPKLVGHRKKFVFKKSKSSLNTVPGKTSSDPHTDPNRFLHIEHEQPNNSKNLDLPSDDNLNIQQSDSLPDYGIEGPHGGYQPFNIKIPHHEYVPLLDLVNRPEARDRRYTWQYPQQKWSPVFDDAFRRDCVPNALKGCTLKFKDHRINRHGENAFLTARAHCTRGGAVKCTMAYNFSIEKEPKKNDDVIVRVQPSGTLHHDHSMFNKRRLAGPKRDQAKKLLASERPSVYRRKVFGSESTDKEALKLGNYTEVQKLSVLIKAKKEGSEGLDLHQNIREDLRLRRILFMEMDHLKSEKCPGFIQEWGNNPFFVSLYSNRQFLLLKKYLSYNPGGLLTLDSTGKVIANLPKCCGAKQAYYYAMVINLPGATESPVVPVLEYITTDHTAMNNSHILHFFFRRFGELYGKDQLGFGIQRIESDCSRTLISAVLQALEVGRTHRYLRDCWECLQKLKKIYIVYHICRNHASHFLSMRIQERFGVTDRDPIFKWSKWYLISESLDQWCRRVQDIILIAGKKWYTPEVDETLRNLDTILNPEDPSLYGSDFLDSVPMSGAVFVVSPFSFFAVTQCRRRNIPLSKSIYRSAGLDDQVLDLDDEANEADYISNSYFCIEFLEYLIHNVFVYGCLFDHSLIRLNGFSTSQDTNAPCESWNRILKHDELGPNLGMKLGRFIAFEEENLRGRLEQFENGLRRMQRRVGQQIDEPTSSQGPQNDDVLCTPESSCETWKARKVSQSRRTLFTSELEGLHVIPFGVFVESPSGPKNLEHLINIDNMLQIIYTLYKIDPESKRFFDGSPKSSIFLSIFQKVEAKLFNEAKLQVIENIMKLDSLFLDESKYLKSEIRFCKSLSPFFRAVQHKKCKKNCIDYQKRQFCYLQHVELKSCEAIPFILKRSRFEIQCDKCGTKDVEVEIDWEKQGRFPFVIFPVSTDPGVIIKEISIPASIGIVGISFKLYAYTYRVGQNFYTVFKDGNRKLLYNSTSSAPISKTGEAPEDHFISTIWYVPKSI